MRGPDGGSLRWEAERQASAFALELARQMREQSDYRHLHEVLPSSRLRLYVEWRIRQAIAGVVTDLVMLEWSPRPAASERGYLDWDGHEGLGDGLAALWALQGNRVKLRPGRERRRHAGVRDFGERSLWQLLSSAPRRREHVTPEATCIAVHYIEGIDPTRRNDLVWWSSSNIPPERILVYATDDEGFAGAEPPSPSVIQRIESTGMRWCSLSRKRGLLRRQHRSWIPDRSMWEPLKAWKALPLDRPREGAGRWLRRAAEALLLEVGYWRAFNRQHNVCMHVDQVEGTFRGVARAIAADVDGGLRVSKQRSELSIPGGPAFLGYYPNHVFFAWGKLSQVSLTAGKNGIERVVLTGFINDGTFSERAEEAQLVRDQMRRRGVRFVVALYDNVYGPKIHYSRRMMTDFYTAFLDWLDEDPEIGLVIKSKKHRIIPSLPEVQARIIAAERTERCVVLGRPYGRHPSDAAHAADMAVGIGISSAVVEAAIAGYRGLHCDLPGAAAHPLSAPGHGRFVFRDLSALMSALKRYKAAPESEPILGDHSPVIDTLDPFRDGGAAGRMGSFLGELLAGLDAGLHRDAALERASSSYAAKWGTDKLMASDPPDAEHAMPARLDLAGIS
jgi:hypothetical protein